MLVRHMGLPDLGAASAAQTTSRCLGILARGLVQYPTRGSLNIELIEVVEAPSAIVRSIPIQARQCATQYGQLQTVKEDSFGGVK